MKEKNKFKKNIHFVHRFRPLSAFSLRGIYQPRPTTMVIIPASAPPPIKFTSRLKNMLG